MNPSLFRDAFVSEWTKFRSVRSTYWCVLLTIILDIGFGAAISAGNASSYKSADLSDRLSFDPTAFATAGKFFAQLALGVMAVLVISSEYSTGTIRTTLSAMPQRGYPLAAKAALVGLLSTALGIGLSFAAFFVCEPIFKNYNIPIRVSIHAPHVLRAVIGSGLYIGVLALLALGLATIIRNTAGAITAVVGLVFIVPILSQLLPDSWQDDFARYLPANAGSAIAATVHQSHMLAPWTGFGVFCLWAAASMLGGWLVLRIRDV